MKTIDRLLIKARKEHKRVSQYAELNQRIIEGTFYDELDDGMRTQYCELHGFNRSVHEDMMQKIYSNGLHFLLAPKRKPKPTEETAKEMREYLQKLSTMTKEERVEMERRELVELDETIKKRRQAKAEGKPMDRYPLPW